MEFGDKIAIVRKQKNLSQSELGKLSSISGDIIGKYERNEMKPSIEAGKKIADALGVTLDYLLGDSEQQNIDKEMLKRFEAILSMPNETKSHVLFFIDMAIRDFITKQAYNEFTK